MGFLHKLWDETLAGPPPDAGLGKLRKYNSFSAARSTAAPQFDPHPIGITRSITVVRRDAQRNLNVAIGSPSTPSSPASSTASSPLSPNSPGGNVKKWMRRKTATTGAVQNPEQESKDFYDWFVSSPSSFPLLHNRPIKIIFLIGF